MLLHDEMMKRENQLHDEDLPKKQIQQKRRSSSI